MNKITLIFLGCITLVLAAPQQATEPVPIVKQESNVDPEGNYQYSYEAANGIVVQESGTLKKSADPQGSDSISVQGSYSYKTPEGIQITLNYIANDEQGFVPQGEHLPTPPPVPPAIQRALEYIAAHPPPTAKP